MSIPTVVPSTTATRLIKPCCEHDRCHLCLVADLSQEDSYDATFCVEQTKGARIIRLAPGSTSLDVPSLRWMRRMAKILVRLPSPATHAAA